MGQAYGFLRQKQPDFLPLDSGNKTIPAAAFIHICPRIVLLWLPRGLRPYVIMGCRTGAAQQEHKDAKQKMELDRLSFIGLQHFAPPAGADRLPTGIFLEGINPAQQRAECDRAGGRVTKFLCIRCQDVHVGFENSEQLRDITDFFRKPPAVLTLNHPGRDPGRQLGFLFDPAS